MKKPTYKGANRGARGGTSKNSSPRKFPKWHLLIAGIIAVSMGIMVLLPSSEVEARRTEIPVSIDAFEPTFNEPQAQTSKPSSPKKTESVDIAEQAIREAARAAMDIEYKLGNWHVSRIKTGDNLSALFQARGLDSSVIFQVSNAPVFGKQLTDIRPGERLEFRINAKGELTQLRYVKSKLESILFSRKDNTYTAKAMVLAPEIRPALIRGTIKNSLFLASQKAGLSERLTMELASIFSWDIDFVLDIRSGDSFTVLYEEEYLQGKKLRDRNILAATFTNQGKTYTAVRYTDRRGETGYYTPDGKSKKKAFLRMPVDFARISSRFNPNRLHPVFKTRRPHRGVDYAAPMNTPIKAAGDGRIKFAGRQNGYGNVVYIEHPNNVVTVYAHASKLKRGIRKGKRVRQGEIIAYVGKTGWATGPHLHYEFRVNNEHRNPVTVKLPDASPIGRKEIYNFKRQTKALLAKLEWHRGRVLASNSNAGTLE